MDSWTEEATLGTGSFGVVTLWKNNKTPMKLALKQCKLSSENQKRKWCQEIQTMFKLNHPYIVKSVPVPECLHNILKSSVPALCMEYCSEGDLRQVLQLSENCCGLLEKEIRNILMHVKSALEYLHSMNITHGDLKPENILLKKLPDNKIVYKLTDLGCYKEVDQNGIHSYFVGTWQYLAPELFLSGIYNNSVDYWSFGLVSFEIISGIRPFLLQTPPTLWLKYVENKRHEHICIFQTVNGNIRYSSRMFLENWISQCFQHDIEQWLQVALEWNSLKRGLCKSNKNIVIFTKLNEILKTKILNLFCCVSYNLLSYEVDDSTVISTLQVWIERDTKILPENQKLLSSDGKKINKDSFAINYYSQDREVMIYVYNSDKVTIPQLKTKLPGLVMKMVQNPMEMLSYFYLKRTIAQMIYFIKREINLFQTFINACKTSNFFIIKTNAEIESISENILLEFNKILSNRKMCGKLLNFDIKCYTFLEKMPNNNLNETGDTIKHWQNMFGLVCNKIDELLSVFLSIQNDIKRTDIPKIKNDFKAEDYEIFELEKFIRSSCKCYENLPRDLEKLSTPVDAVKILSDFLKRRSASLKNEKLMSYLRNLWICESKLENISASIITLKNQIINVKSDIMNIQFKRHKDMWQFIAKTSSQKTIKWPDLENETEKNMYTSQTSHDVIHQAKLTLLNDADTMISDNENLRNKIFGNLKETIYKYHVIKDESDSIDWTFLDTDEKND